MGEVTGIQGQPWTVCVVSELDPEPRSPVFRPAVQDTTRPPSLIGLGTERVSVFLSLSFPLNFSFSWLQRRRHKGMGTRL